MSDAPRPLDYAMDMNADPSAARYLRWVVSGIAMLLAAEQMTEVSTFIYDGFFTPRPPYWTWDGIQPSRWIENGTRLIAILLLLAGILFLLRRTRLGARILLCVFLGCALINAFESVRIHLQYMSDGWKQFGASAMIRAYMMTAIGIASHGVTQLLLVTPPMARLMRLR